MSVKNTFSIEHLPKTLRKMRKLAGLSQIELAQLCGVGKALIFEIEKGKQRVSLEKLLLIFKVLNLKLVIKTPVELSDEE